MNSTTKEGTCHCGNKVWTREAGDDKGDACTKCGCLFKQPITCAKPENSHDIEKRAVTEIVRAHRDKRPIDFGGKPIPYWVQKILEAELA